MPFNFRKRSKLQIGPIHHAVDRTSLSDCPFIDEHARAALLVAGITSIEDIPGRIEDPASLDALAKTTSLRKNTLERFASIAVLLEIPGLHPPLGELLVAAGVTSVAELSRREAGRLADALLAIQTERKSAYLLPSAAVVEGWIEHARRSTRRVSTP